ncbi:hypothetical protein MN608_02177 [Microdochium nivale]|nr:hypothetical protein MN608_02177 [Microdochium nivale]
MKYGKHGGDEVRDARVLPRTHLNGPAYDGFVWSAWLPIGLAVWEFWRSLFDGIVALKSSGSLQQLRWTNDLVAILFWMGGWGRRWGNAAMAVNAPPRRHMAFMAKKLELHCFFSLR